MDQRAFLAASGGSGQAGKDGHCGYGFHPQIIPPAGALALAPELDRRNRV
jgi:hypothetical protein